MTEPCGVLISAEGVVLPLVGARLSATAAGGIAEVVLEQRFRNAQPVPLTVTYDFPLPCDAAVSGYAITVGQRRIVGEIDRRASARERFEQALVEGKTAALVDQDRSSLFRQEIGNVAPGAEVLVSLTLDQRLRWLDEGVWEWRFPTAAGPRYVTRDSGGDVREIAEGKLDARLELALTIGDALAGPAESPSHRIQTTGGTIGLPGGVALDRDMVVRWPVARPRAGLSVERARPPAGAPHGEAGYGLLTIVPAAQGPAPLPRDLVVLLDTSGSMAGAPLEQARRLVSALVDTLGEGDRLELLEFSRAPRRWRETPAAVTPAIRREALQWLATLEAGGGTEMGHAVVEALRPLRPDSQRQVVLVTDGLIGFEAQVVGAIARDLPASSRLHTVGVGSAVNRSLTGAAARAGRGAELVMGLGEDVERAARRLVARTAAPVLIDLTVSGPALYAHAPRRLPDLHAGAPVLVGLALRPEGGALAVEGRTTRGTWRETVQVPAIAPGEGRQGVVKLYARERIEDLETTVASDVAWGSDAPSDSAEREIERLGLEFQVASRLTSWIAVAEEASTEPGRPARRVRMPQEMPYGMSVESVGLRLPAAAARGALASAMGFAARSPRPLGISLGGSRPMRGFVPPRAQIGPELPPPPGASEILPPAGVSIRTDQRRFRGRVVQHQDGVLVVHFQVEGDDLVWRLGAEVEVLGADGARAPWTVLEGSPPATVRAGEEIRVSIRAGQAPLPRELVVAGGPQLVVVML